jgi:autotransporter adhesin
LPVFDSTDAGVELNSAGSGVSLQNLTRNEDLEQKDSIGLEAWLTDGTYNKRYVIDMPTATSDRAGFMTGTQVDQLDYATDAVEELIQYAYSVETWGAGIENDISNLNSGLSLINDKVNTISKELSAGIASTAALSSIAVSDVKKGEVSVGGGYGSYNSQSAVAFGGAVGITDSWSFNAGIGLANKGENTFRVGTNVKFKAF